MDKQIQSPDRRLDRLYEVLETGALDLSDLAPRIKQLVAKKAELQQVRIEVENTMSQKKNTRDLGIIRDYAADLKKLLASAPIMDQKALLKSFVKSVDVSDKSVTMNYTIPMPVFSPTRDSVGVLALETSGRPYRSRTCDTLIKSHGVLV